MIGMPEQSHVSTMKGIMQRDTVLDILLFPHVYEKTKDVRVLQPVHLCVCQLTYQYVRACVCVCVCV